MRQRGFVSALVFAVAASQCPAQDAAQIVGRATLFGGAPALTMAITMTIHRPTGTKERRLELNLARSADRLGPTRLLVRIVSPAFLSQMKFLSHRNPDGEDASWLRTSGGVRRLSQSNRDESLFDSDFTVEDLTELSVERYKLEYVGSADLDGVSCEVVRALPLAAGEARKVLYVDRASTLVRRVDVMDARERLARRYTLDQTQVVAGSIYPLTCTMRGQGEESYTVLRFDRIEPVRTLPDRLFNRANL